MTIEIPDPSYTTNRSITLRYRPDIDGLRAVAIALVLAFHAGLFSAGYVGVDIFFVISGFLIASLILEEASAHQFGFADFYVRRIRRLFPAAAFLLVFVIFFTLITFSTSDLRSFSKSLAAFVLLCSNWNFLAETGYFDTAASTKPLLHTWSLSIEEQFYLLFPALLIVTRSYRSRYGKYIFWSALLLASLAFQEWLSITGRNDAVYFNSTARFWELLAGVLCSFINRDFTISPRLAWPLGLLGTFLIAIAAPLHMHAGTLFGLTMLVPILGSAFIILAGGMQTRGANKALAIGPLVFVGKISYALYLWHWPALLFVHMLLPVPDGTGSAIALGITCLFAVLSYFAVERPVRSRAILKTNRAVLIFFAVFCFSFATIGLVGYAADDWIESGIIHFIWGGKTAGNASPTGLEELTMENLLTKIEAAKTSIRPESNNCLYTDGANFLEKLERGELCEIGTHTSGPVDMLVVGDSHIWVLYPLFEALAKKYDLRGQLIGCTANPPLLGVWPQDKRQPFCKDYYSKLYDYIRSTKPKHLILVGRWTGYLEGEIEKNNKTMTATDDKQNDPATAMRQGFRRSADSLPADVDISVMSQPPEFDMPVPDEMQNAARRTDNIAAALTTIDIDEHLWLPVDKETQRLDAMRNMLADAGRIRFIDISNTFCSQGRCVFHDKYTPLYRDSNHVSVDGALLIAKRNEDSFEFLGK